MHDGVTSHVAEQATQYDRMCHNASDDKDST